MSKDMMVQYLIHNKGPDNKQFRLVVQAAPFWKGMKESCILILNREDLKGIVEELKETRIRHYILDRINGRCIVFFYREEELNAYLRKAEVQEFLKNYGYIGNDLEHYLERLKTRVAYFYEKDHAFPHEVGAFLGYPMEDVEGFIEHRGRDYQMSGYWKVYGDVRRARRMFHQFDQAQREAMMEWSRGMALGQIAVS